MVAGSSQHALDLVVLALLEHDFELVLAALDAGLRRQRRRLVVQLHAAQQLGHQFVGHRILRGGLVNFRNMALRRRLGMDKRAIVGHQQHAGGVVVEPAYRLHFAPGELLGQ